MRRKNQWIRKLGRGKYLGWRRDNKAENTKANTIEKDIAAGQEIINILNDSQNNDNKVYYELGKVSLRVSAEFELYDSSDLDKGEKIYYPGDFLTTAAGIVYNFIPENTEFVVEGGVITKMYRRYIP